MNLSAQKAAELVGMSKPGIIKAIKTGKLSATKDLNNEWAIDPAELFRVYTPVNLSPEVVDTSEGKPAETSLPQNGAETLVLQMENRQLQQRLLDKDDVINDLRRRLDAEADERRRVTYVLTTKIPDAPSEGKPEGKAEAKTEPKPLSWWQRWFG